ncbi:MAG TPA: hypothetical protein VMD59_04805 [Acidimicrobiales bacterium]|nr:hypothetical protein [Acidimicrobiales bacterium]
MAVAGAAGGSWLEGTLRFASVAALASVLAAEATALLVALAAGRGRQQAATRRFLSSAWSGARRGLRHPTLVGMLVLAWGLLALAVLAWDLTSLVAASPHLPTLSRLSGDVTRHHLGRAALSLVWLALGATIALGGRTRGRHGAVRR